MKNLYKVVIILSSIFLLSACSGDGQGSFDTGLEKIIVTDCEVYTLVQTNDLLVKDEDNTVIKTVHDANGTKKICVSAGSAHIIREN